MLRHVKGAIIVRLPPPWKQARKKRRRNGRVQNFKWFLLIAWSSRLFLRPLCNLSSGWVLPRSTLPIPETLRCHRLELKRCQARGRKLRLTEIRLVNQNEEDLRRLRSMRLIFFLPNEYPQRNSSWFKSFFVPSSQTQLRQCTQQKTWQGRFHLLMSHSKPYAASTSSKVCLT